MIKRLLKIITESVLFYRIRSRKKQIRFLKGCQVRECEFEGYNTIGINNVLNHVEFGLGTYTAQNVNFGRVKIGRFCSIGSYVRNARGRHPTSVFVSTHPSFFSKSKVAGFTFSQKQYFNELHYSEDGFLVSIGNDVWIGDNVIIMDGITIGDGAVIGAGAVVTKDVEPYSINVGIPAKKIKSRFNEIEVDWLLKFKWWEKDFGWIKTNSGLFIDMGKFMQNLKK